MHQESKPTRSYFFMYWKVSCNNLSDVVDSVFCYCFKQKLLCSVDSCLIWLLHILKLNLRFFILIIIDNEKLYHGCFCSIRFGIKCFRSWDDQCSWFTCPYPWYQYSYYALIQRNASWFCLWCSWIEWRNSNWALSDWWGRLGSSSIWSLRRLQTRWLH